MASQNIKPNRPSPDAPAPTDSWIQKTPGVCGGEACIRRTRSSVWLLVESRQLGISDQRLLSDYPHLTQADLDAAWRYYDQHREEIHEVIRKNQEA